MISLETIDAIARRLQRDVVYLDIRERMGQRSRDRHEVTAATVWLDAEEIGWEMCLGFLPRTLLIKGGPRAIYIDTPFEPGSPLLRKLDERFETPDGQPRHPNLVFTLLTLEDALINAGQDSPGFWDRI